MSALDEITDARQHDTKFARELARKAAAELKIIRDRLSYLEEQADAYKGVDIDKAAAELAQLRAELDKKDVRIEELDMALKMMHFGKDDR